MQTIKKIKVVANNSNNSFTSSLTKVDTAKHIADFFDTQSASCVSEDLFDMYHAFIRESEDMDKTIMSNMLFTIQQVNKLLSALEASNNIVHLQIQVA